jgi:hypothetical protein
VAYDLILGAETCLRVTVGSGAPEIELSATPRPAAEVQFQLATDPTGLARLLAAGRLRRLLRGRALEPLRLLVRTPLRPRQLLSAGVELDPPLVLQLVAVVAEANPTSQTDPWSAVGPPLFTLAHRLPSGETIATLHVQAGGRATVTATGLESPAATTVTCPPGRLLAALLGERGAGIAVEGDDRPLGLVRSWLERA